MSIRNQLATISVLLASPTCLQAFSADAAETGNQRPPNIVYIIVDDMGYGDLGVTGQTHFATPRIDRMAAEGLLFTDAYAGSTVCAPARATLFAGQHTGHVWQRGNVGPIQFREDPLDPTVASLLRDAGYATALVGKSGFSCNSEDGGLPNRKGFDYFFGMTSHARAHRHFPEWVWRNGERVDVPGNRGYVGETYISELFTDEAIEWIKQQDADKPFFLHLALTPPHADLTVPDRFLETYLGHFEETPNTTGGYFRQSYPKATYAGMIAFLDYEVGRVLDALSEQGFADNTIVFFTSDNGPSSAGGKKVDEFDSNGPYRGGKRDLYEGGIRVPLIAYWPGTIGPGRTSDLPTAMWDFLPTAAELAGVASPTWTDGISIVPTLLARTEDQEKHEYLYWEFYERGGSQAVRMGPWKAVRRKVLSGPGLPIELYNLTTDPGEARDIAKAHPEIVSRMRQIMTEAHTPNPVFSLETGIDQNAVPILPSRLLEPAPLVSSGNWRIVSVSSESNHNGALARKAIDGNPRTRWHTQWHGASPRHPHHLTVDLGQSTSVAGFRYLPRQDGVRNGGIRSFSIYLAEDADERGEPIAHGEFDATANQKEIRFDQPQTGRYFTIIAHNCVANTPYTSAAEIELLAE